MNTLTLEDSLRLTAKMWSWMGKELQATDEMFDEDVIVSLKERWLMEHGHGNIKQSCFLCEYAYQGNNRRSIECDLCPLYHTWNCGELPEKEGALCSDMCASSDQLYEIACYPKSYGREQSVEAVFALATAAKATLEDAELLAKIKQAHAEWIELMQ